MYHNLSMGLSGVQSAREAVYDPFSLGASGTNLNLSAWYNYNQTPYGIMTFSLTNNNVDNDITVTIYLRDPTTTPATDYQIGNPVPATFFLPAASGITNYNDYDTGIVMDATNFSGGIYQIAFDLSAFYTGPPPPPGGGVTGNTTTASDTDNVGAGVTRATTNPPNFDMNNPIVGAPLVRGNITGNDGIYINKRTTFDIVFN